MSQRCWILVSIVALLLVTAGCGSPPRQVTGSHPSLPVAPSGSVQSLESAFGLCISPSEPAGLMAEPLPKAPALVGLEVRNVDHPAAAFVPIPGSPSCNIQPGQSAVVKTGQEVASGTYLISGLKSPWAAFPNAAWQVGPGGWGDNIMILPVPSQPGRYLFVLLVPAMGVVVNGLENLTSGTAVPVAYGLKPSQDISYRTWIVESGQWYRLSETVTATQPPQPGYTDYQIIPNSRVK